MLRRIVLSVLVVTLCIGMTASLCAKGDEPFTPVADAPGYQLAVDIIAFTATFEAATQAVSNAKTALVQMSSNKATMDSLDAKIKAAQTIDKPKEKDAALKPLLAERDTLLNASAAELAEKKDLSAEQKVQLGKIGKNLLIAAAFDATAVVAANDLIKQCTATSSDISGQISKNPLKSGKLKGNLSYINAASSSALPAVVTGAPTQVADIAGMLVTVGKMATANGVALPDAKSVTAKDTMEE